MASGKVQVDQVLVEVHKGHTIDVESISELFYAADRAKLRVFHKERNHWGCGGYRCLEYALVSESFIREANRAIIC